MRRIVIWIAPLVGLLLVQGAMSPYGAAAATFFVRAGGSDSNDGSTPQTAFASIRRGGRALLNPGDRIIVGPGEYREGNIEPRRGGTAAAPVELLADPTGALTGDPAGEVRVVPPETPDQTTAFILFGKHHVRIQGFTIVGSTDPAIQVRPAAQSGGSSGDISIRDVTIRGGAQGIDILAAGSVELRRNVIEQTGYAVAVNRGGGEVQDLTFEDNVIRDNARGVEIAFVRRLHASRNLFEENLERGLSLAIGDSAEILNNTFKGSRIAMDLFHGTSVPATVKIAGNLTEGSRVGIALLDFGAVDLSIQTSTIRGAVLGIALTNVATAQIDAVTIEGSRRGVSLMGGGTVSISASTIKQGGGAVVLRGDTGSVSLTQSRIEDCVRGIHGDARDRVVVNGNQFLRTSNGVRVDAAVVELLDNRFEDGSRAAGIGAQTARLSGNRVLRLDHAFALTATVTAEVSANEVSDTVRGFLFNARRIVMANNTLSAVAQPAEVRAVHAVITGNRASGARYPLLIHDAATLELHENEITGIAAGILYETRRTTHAVLRATGNLLQGGCFRVDASGQTVDVQLQSNRINDCPASALRIRTRGAVDIARTEINRAAANGIELGLGAGAAVVTENRIDGALDGVVVAGTDSLTARGNVVRNVRKHGIVASAVLNATVASNQIESAANDAVNIGGDAVLSGDCDRNGTVSVDEVVRVVARVFDNDPAGDCSAAADDGQVSAASVVRAVLAATSASAPRAARAVEVADNSISGSGGLGILAFATRRLAVYGNTVRLAERGGIALQASMPAAVTLEENVVEDNGGEGITLAGGFTVAATANQVRRCAGNGVRLRDAITVSFQGNQISAAGASGVRATNMGAWSSRDNRIERTGVALHLGGARPRGLFAVLAQETISSSAAAAIIAEHAGLLHVTRSTVRDTGGDAIVALDSGILWLSDLEISNSAGTAIRIGTPEASSGDEVVLEGNALGGFGDSGIDAYANGRFVARSNRILAAAEAAGAGVAVRYGTGSSAVAVVSGNEIRGAAGDGVFVENAGRAFVWDNQVYSAGQTGILLRGMSSTEVVNNLSYDHGEDGVRLEHPGAARVFNNTLYANRRWGLASQDATDLRILNNVFDSNQEGSVVLGIGDAPQTQEGFNLSTGLYVGLLPAATDIMLAPGFVDADGADNLLGAANAGDDNFRLQSGDAASPAIDAGSDTAELFGISGSARADMAADSGLLDLGFHYGAAPRIP